MIDPAVLHAVTMERAATEYAALKTTIREGLRMGLIELTANHQPTYKFRNTGLAVGFTVTKNPWGNKLVDTSHFSDQLLRLDVDLELALKLLLLFKPWHEVKKILEPTYAYITSKESGLITPVINKYLTLLEHYELMSLMDNVADTNEATLKL